MKRDEKNKQLMPASVSVSKNIGRGSTDLLTEAALSSHNLDHTLDESAVSEKIL